MKFQGRNLSIEMQGEEVKLLHSKPKLLDPFIADNKLNDRQGIRNGFIIKLKSMGDKLCIKKNILE